MSGQVVEGNEREVPSKFNLEGQNATNPSSAVQSGALPSAPSEESGSTSTAHDGGEGHDNEKPKEGDGAGAGAGAGPGGKPKMEKYAYHCMSPLSLQPMTSRSPSPYSPLLDMRLPRAVYLSDLLFELFTRSERLTLDAGCWRPDAGCWMGAVQGRVQLLNDTQSFHPRWPVCAKSFSRS